MKLRKATEHDMPEIKRIARDVIRHDYPAFLGAEAIAAFVDGGMSDQEIEDGFDGCVLIETGGVIAAFAITKGDLLHLIMVDVPFQRLGYGGALLTHVESEMFRAYDCIYLQSFLENRRATRFYEKYDWHIFEREKVPELDVTMVRYQKIR